MNNKATFILISLLLNPTGCASMVMDTNRKLTVEADDASSHSVPAKCDLKNDKSEWAMSAPGSIDIARSAADLLISCVSDDGTFAGKSRVESSANSGMYGNVFGIGGGGLLGLAIDHHTGKGFDYPDKVTVMMSAQKDKKIVAASTTSN